MHLNAHLIGVNGGVGRLATPALVVDLELLDANIETLARKAKAAGKALRPHAKTHKCSAVARRQFAAGAAGVCVAKLGEAEALADAGIGSILVTTPIVFADQADRAAALAARLPDFMVTVDNEAGAEALSRAAAARGVVVRVLIDVDVGLRRTGAHPARVAHLASIVARLPGLSAEGVQGYAGHIQHLPGADARAIGAAQAAEQLSEAVSAVREAGIDVRIVSGGGTGSAEADLAGDVFTELQCGSYVFMDREYDEAFGAGGGGSPFRTSLFVQSRVTRNETSGVVTIDAGLKAMATDKGPPAIVSGAPEGASYFFFGDEQGGIAWPGEPPSLGQVVRLQAPHCDPTVDRYDVIHAVRGDTLDAIWKIEARGRSA